MINIQSKSKPNSEEKSKAEKTIPVAIVSSKAESTKDVGRDGAPPLPLHHGRAHRRTRNAQQRATQENSPYVRPTTVRIPDPHQQMVYEIRRYHANQGNLDFTVTDVILEGIEALYQKMEL